MSNIGRDWLFIDASQTVIEEKKTIKRERKREMADRTLVDIYINLFLYFPDA
jgi:hypothetical protein